MKSFLTLKKLTFEQVKAFVDGWFEVPHYKKISLGSSPTLVNKNQFMNSDQFCKKLNLDLLAVG